MSEGWRTLDTHNSLTIDVTGGGGGGGDNLDDY